MAAEEAVREIAILLALLVEVSAVAIVAIGVGQAILRFAGSLRRTPPRQFLGIRLAMGRHLVLALEFQLASDILRTTVAPTFRQLGQLAAVAAIRTALNLVLEREIRREQSEVEGGEPRGEAADR
jgi:uncharacterized membrane protein